MTSEINKSNYDSLARSKSPISVGGDLGSKIGCLFSILYALIGIFIEQLLSGSNLVWAGLILVLFIVIPPATFLGLFTGFLIGWLAKIFVSRFSQQAFILVSTLVCAIGVMLLHIIAFAFLSDTSGSSEINYGIDFYIIDKYYFVIGIPSLIYIFVGGWLGRKLYQKLLS